MLVVFVQSDANARLKEKIRFRATRIVENILFLAHCPLARQLKLLKLRSLWLYWLKSKSKKKRQNLTFSTIFMDNFFDGVSEHVFANCSDDNVFVNFICLLKKKEI